MKLAVTVWNQRIAPVFDSAGTARLFDIREGARLDGGSVLLQGKDLDDRARALRSHDVDELICGAISREAERMVLGEGISVRSFVAGDVERVVQAWMRNELGREEYSMPGCACARRRGRRRRGRCRGLPSEPRSDEDR